MQHSEGWFAGKGNIRLYHQSWAPDGDARGVLLIVHGLFEHSGRYTSFAEYYTAFGFAVCSYDQRGHGKSEGPRGYVNRFEDFLVDLTTFHGLVRSTFPHHKLFLLGHSVGGTIATAYAKDYQRDLSGLILSASTLKPGSSVTPLSIFIARSLSVLFPKLGISPIDATAISRDNRVVEAYRNDPLVYHGKISARLGTELINTMQKILPAKMAKIELPVLIIHGALDQLSNPEGSTLVYESVKSKDKTLKYYESLYHEIFNEPERLQVLSDVKQWLMSHI